MKITESYYELPTTKRTTVRYDLPNEEYIEAEPFIEDDGEHFAVVTWTTSKDWSKTEKSISKVLSSVSGLGEAHFWRNKSTGEIKDIGGYPDPLLKTKTLQRRIHWSLKPPIFVRINNPDHSLIWTETSHPEVYGNFIVMITGWDVEYLDLLARRTGTDNVVSSAMQIFESCNLMKEWLPDTKMLGVPRTQD